MCGIVGYIGEKEKKKVILDGLKELEYRGYDSAGIAVLKDNRIDYFKAVGKLNNLIAKTEDFESYGEGVAIGHTRWATHGKPTELNAHPHLGKDSFVVHNGIIENYKDIKEELEKEGINFLSQTDTEVIVHLFERYLSKGLNSFEAFKKMLNRLEGAYAILLITRSSSNKIFFAKNGSPLLIAPNRNEIYFASSDTAVIGKVKEAYYLEDGDYGWANIGEINIFNKDKNITPNMKPLPSNIDSAKKDGYRFFMEKEIYEQSIVTADTILGRVLDDKVYFEEIPNGFFDDIRDIRICACGSSYHAALTASYLFERVAKIRCSVEIASEFRYKEPLLQKDTLFISVSQSGETADTLEALKMVKRAGVKTVAICNMDNSSIVRESDIAILTRAGIEKGVASTKSFATQLLTLWMLSLYLAQDRDINRDILEKEIDAIRHIPSVLKVEESLHQKIHRLSKRYLHGHGFFFIGRDIFYPLALEGALKLKEISYLHAEGYPAGEMKHGPIALADSELFTIALMPSTILSDKIRSNVEELSARDATILAISAKPFDIADDFIAIKYSSHPMLEFFEMMLVTQLLALEISIRLGNDVDMPRNLAKSVTVE